MSDFLINPFSIKTSVFSWGTKYSDPSTLIATTAYGLDISPTNDAIIVRTDVWPYLHAYAWNNGFGTKYNDPASFLLGTAIYNPLCFSTNGAYIFTISSGNPIILAIAWDSTNGFGTVINSPVNFGVSSTNGLTINFFDTVVACIRSSTYPLIVSWSNTTGFGTRYSPWTSNITGTNSDIAFSPSNNAVLFTDTNYGFGAAFRWDDTNGLQTRYSDPAIAFIGNSAYSGDFSYGNDAVVVATGSGHEARFWDDNNGFGSRPSTISPTSSRGSSAAFTQNDTAVLLSGSAGVTAYDWKSGWYGSGTGRPTGSPTGACYSIRCSKNNTFAVFGYSITPYIYAYPISFT